MAECFRIPKFVPLALASVAQLRLVFRGSFQCRLATEAEPTDRKPGPAPADGIIRFSKPVQLRSALMDPWEDVKVTLVESSFSRDRLTMGGGKPGPGVDPLVGKVVSLGPARFDTRLGKSYRSPAGIPCEEAISGLSLNIGGGLVTAEPDNPPPLCARKDPDVKPWSAEYQTRKPGLVEVHRKRMDPARRDTLERIDHLADGFEEVGTYVGPLKNFRCNAASRFNPKNWFETPFHWTIDMTFFRYDADTLTGRVDGQIYATAQF